VVLQQMTKTDHNVFDNQFNLEIVGLKYLGV